MSDWTDFLEDFSSGAAGVVAGLTAGAKPFDAWEGVRTKDIANDRGELTNRDLELMQWARENPDIDYYGNAVGAVDVGNRRKISQGEFDIYGDEQKLALTQYLSDPEGAFQQGLRETGWEPGSPEYRAWLAEAISQYDPTAAVAAYDKFNIPGIENRNLNEQAALRFIESYAQQKDPGARVQRNPDGTISIISNGEETQVPGDLVVKVASMINAKTPYDAISGGLKDEIGIQNNNINLIKALRDGKVTPAAAVNVVKENGVRLNQLFNAARQDLTNIAKSDDYKLATPEERAVMVAEPQRRVEQYRKQAEENALMLNQLLRGYAMPQLGQPSSAAPRPRITPQGGASVTTRPAPGALASRAAGGARAPAGAPWGSSSAGPNRYQTEPWVAPEGLGPEWGF